MTDSPALETRPFYWSVRRELWENRSIFVGPLAIACVVQLGVLISTLLLPHRMPRILALDPGKQHEAITGPYSAIAGALIVTAFLVGAFYCLDALYGERRDRSILFWKSLPVSDRITVLSKAMLPLVVLPAIVFSIAIAAQLIVLMLSTMVMMGNAPGLALVWSNMKFVQSSIALLYGLIAITLWHAPIYTWLLLISGWAKRAPFLWAVLPFLAVAAVERIVFNTSYIFLLLGHRMTGWFTSGFTFTPHGSNVVVEPLAHLTPGRFLSAPGLWIGLVLAAAFLVAAVRLRRFREPI
jgi:ABC-2 type transport system permease protein